MKLTQLKLKNFRCFDELEIDFHEQLTVLIAANGAGKTTVLDAARIALSAYIKGIDVSSARPHVLAKITRDDVRQIWISTNMQPQLPSSITAYGNWGEHLGKSWEVWRESVAPNKRMRMDADANELTKYATALQDQARSPDTSDETELPLITYLGTGRLWFQGRYTKRIAESDEDTSDIDDSDNELDTDSEPDLQMYERIWGYENCLVASSSFKQFHEWYLWLFKSYQELQVLQTEEPTDTNATDLAVLKAAVDAVQQAINEVLGVTGWRDLQYRRSAKALVMHNENHGYMPLKLLSDGVRNTVAMVADIAFRCVRLNPQFGKEAAFQTKGVVLIDEVDMFLHPKWQQQIIGSLQRAFPKLQFIVTTHSPQVLTTVPNHCIRILDTIKKNDRDLFFARKPDQQSRGVASNDLLAELQYTNPTPDVPEARWLSEYKALIQQSLHATPKGYDLKKKILDHFGDHHREWRECERLIRLQAIKAKLPPSNQ